MKNQINNSKLTGSIVLPFAVFLFIATSCKKDNVEQNSAPWYPETNLNGDSIYGAFENKLPCSDQGCAKIKFALAVYKNAQTNSPTTYLMARVYVARDENGRITNNGDISISTGIPSDATVTVYNLTSGAPDEFKHFWKINDDLLFILDNDLKPRIGNAEYGYVLNRTR
jgi:hypothetical protein